LPTRGVWPLSAGVASFSTESTESRPLLPCHPRDLLNMALDFQRYQGADGRQPLTPPILTWAWRNYFVSLVAH